MAKDFHCAAFCDPCCSVRAATSRKRTVRRTDHHGDGQADHTSAGRNREVRVGLSLLCRRGRAFARFGANPARENRSPRDRLPARRDLRGHALEFSLLAVLPRGGASADGRQRHAAQRRAQRSRV